MKFVPSATDLVRGSRVAEICTRPWLVSDATAFAPFGSLTRARTHSRGSGVPAYAGRETWEDTEALQGTATPRPSAASAGISPDLRPAEAPELRCRSALREFRACAGGSAGQTPPAVSTEKAAKAAYAAMAAWDCSSTSASATSATS